MSFGSCPLEHSSLTDEYLRNLTCTLQLIALLGGILKLTTDEKLDRIIKIFILLILMFVLIFCLLLLMDWLLGDFGWDYIPGVGKGSGDQAFISDFFGIS